MLSQQNTTLEKKLETFSEEAFLNKKNIDLHVLQHIELTFQTSIAEHSKFAFEQFYSKPYLKAPERTDDIARYHHGIAHANRVAAYIPVFANLYRKHNDAAALLLTDDDIKLTQLAGLFHDACRENDGEDLWDADSGLLLYLYLKAIGVDENKSKLLAEAIANKDTSSHKSYQELIIHANGNLSWEKVNARPRNIYQQLLHDADCIDIIRARNHFDATYLNFYKKIAKKNSIANAEMAQLITEVRSIIELQGDSKQVSKPAIKAKYEHEAGFQQSLELFNLEHYSIVKSLYNAGKILSKEALENLCLVDTEPYDSNKGLDEINMYRAMREGKLFARGAIIVSGVSSKKITHNDGSTEEEPLGAIDIRKADRRLGVPTTSSKPNKNGSKPNIEKNGNPNRSVTMLGYGASAFSDAGFLIVNPNKDSVTTVSAIDAGTGFRKKEYLGDRCNQLTAIEKEKQLHELHQLLMHGGSSRYYNSVRFASTHNEITYNINHFDAIYFTLDPTLRNALDLNNPSAVHRWTPLLKAYYLQNEYKKKHGTVLPIFEYSGLHNSIRAISAEEYSNELILKMWSALVEKYYDNLKQTFTDMTDFAKKTVDEVKVFAMYGLDHLRHTAEFISHIAPPDNNYPEELQYAVTQKIIELKKDKYENYYTDFGRLVLTALIDDFEKFTSLYEKIDKTSITQNQYSILMRAVIWNASEKIFSWMLSNASNDTLGGIGDVTGLTPVYVAASRGHVSMLKRLIEKGVNPNFADNDGDTPMKIAVQANHHECVEVLLSAKVDPNAVWMNKCTPLSDAILYNAIDVVSVLLKNGVDVNQLCFLKPTTPLMFAVVLNSRATIVLLDHGVKIDEAYPIHIDCIYLANAKESFKEKLNAFYSGHIPEMLFLTPLQLAVLSGNTSIVEILLARGALFTKNVDGKKAIRLDHVMGQDSFGSLLMSEAPDDCQVLIREAIEDYSKNLKEDESIDEIAENKVLMKYFKEKTYSTVSIIEAYWKQHQKPLTLSDTIDHNDILRRDKRFLAAINMGKVVGFAQDSCGRFLATASAHDNNYIYDFTSCDFSKINFSQFCFEKFKLSGTHWHFASSDKTTFIKCHMDDFSITKESDLSGITIVDPVFSSPYMAMKVANLFATIPPFIIKPEYIEAVRTLVATGKKIQFGNNWDMYNCLHRLMTNNALELFCFILETLQHDKQYSKYFKDLIKESIEVGNRESFIDAILKHQVVDLHNNHQVRDEPMRFAIQHNKYKIISKLLSYDANTNDILDHHNVFHILRSMIEGAYQHPDKENKSISLSTAHIHYQLLFYSIAERLLYIAAYMIQQYTQSDDKILAHTLINQLEQAYVDNQQGKNARGILEKIEAEVMLLLKRLSNNHPLLQKAMQVNERAINRFTSNLWNDHYVNFSCQALTNDDIDDLCEYLRQNPCICKIRFYKTALSPAALTALTKLPSILKLEFKDCRLTDAAARVFADACYLEKLAIYDDHGMTLTGAKLMRGNTHIKSLYCENRTQSKKERQAWDKIIKEEDLTIRRIFAEEAKHEYTLSAKKYVALNTHLAHLEKQLQSVGHGKRGRCKKNNLHEQVLFFRTQLVSDAYLAPSREMKPFKKRI